MRREKNDRRVLGVRIACHTRSEGVTPKDEPGINNWLEIHRAWTSRSTHRPTACALWTHPSRTDTREIDLEKLSILYLHICIIT